MTEPTATTPEPGPEKTIRLTPIQRQVIEIPIIGVSPLIPHKWSEKSKRLMRVKQSGAKAQPKLDPKDALAEAEASLYRLDDGRPGMPASAFAAATRTAARFFGKDVTLVAMKSALFVAGEGDEQLVPILGEPTMREDTPRNSNGVADLRYRYSFWPWSAVLRVTFLPSIIDAESVLALVDAGGNGGVGDWRPSAPKSMTGTFGRFEVKL